MLAPFSFFYLFFAVTLWPFSPAAGPAREVKKTQIAIPQDISQASHVRVLVTEDAKTVQVNTESPYVVHDEKGRKLFSGTRIAGTQIRPSASGIQIGRQAFPSTTLRIDVQEGELRVGPRRYPYAIEFVRNAKGNLDVINELPIEEYLQGVLPLEVSASWPAELLKAQAVASRTYALFRVIENKDELYAVVSDVKSQVYGGRKAEHGAATRAIEMTRGEVLTYQGKLFPAFFHSTCGGRTTRADLIWNVEKHPCLMGVGCRFCQNSKHYRWTGKFTAAELQTQLKKFGLASQGGLVSMAAVDRDASGRAQNFLVKFRSGQYKVPSVDLRTLMGSFRFKSTLIQSIEPVEGGFVFKGRGWGHGVGLCQYGAKELASLGYTYPQILEYYYPGSSITRLEI